EIAEKLQGEKLLKNPEAASLAVNLLRFVHSPARTNRSPESAAPAVNVPLLSEQEYKDLFQKTLSEGLAYSARPTDSYTPEKNSAQNILNSLRSMPAEMQGLAPESTAVVEKRTVELNTPADS